MQQAAAGLRTATSSFPTSGGREYRLYVPAWQDLVDKTLYVTAAMSTSTRYSVTSAHFAVAGFNTSTAQVGQVVKATIDVRPAGTVKLSVR